MNTCTFATHHRNPKHRNHSAQRNHQHIRKHSRPPSEETHQPVQPAQAKMVFRTTSSALLLFGMLLSFFPHDAHGAIGDQLVYRVTVRDMLHGECVGSNAAHRARYATAWGAGSVPDAAVANNCSFTDQINSGELEPNVDFQGGYFIDGFPQNEGLNVTFEGSERGDILPIVNETLAQDESGLQKLQYCSKTERCGKHKVGNDFSTAGYDSFQQWYNDDRRTNRRIGSKLVLTDTKGDGTFEYNLGGFYSPISDNIPLPPIAEIDPDNAQRWDKTKLQANGRQFFITTEIHTFFQYRGGEEFVFSGDDDVWVFINDVLAMDLSGVHRSVTATMLLDDNRHRLGLEINKTYSLELFHAERQYSQSNFRISTTLVSACNVLQSGNVSVAFPPVNNDAPAIEWVTSRNSFVDDTNGAIVLTDGLTHSTSEFVYHPVQQNIGAGFVLEFDFVFPDKRTADSDGFAFVMHSAPDELEDLPTSTSGNLGFRFLRNSAVLALDMCPDRPNCDRNTQRLSLHYVNVDSAGVQHNDASDETRQRTALVPNPLNKGATHTMRVIYYENPSYLEVYLDDSLYLVDKEFNPLAILGGRDAYVGFSTGTSATYAASVHITRWEMDTVGVSVPDTEAYGFLAELEGDADSWNATSSSKPLVIIDGNDEAEYMIKTADRCTNKVDSGGLKKLLNATMVVSPDARRLLTENSKLDNSNYGDVRIPVKRVEDNLDGTYSVIFSTTVLGPHDLFISFGDECVEGDAFDAHQGNLLAADERKACWTASYTNVMDTQSQPTTSPTGGFIRETFAPTPAPDDGTAAMAVGTIAGGAVGMCFVMSAAMLFYRRRWTRSEVYVARGKQAKLDAEMQYEVKKELTDLQHEYQKVKQALLAAQARQGIHGTQEQIREIQGQMKEMSINIFNLKKKKQRMSSKSNKSVRHSVRNFLGGRASHRQQYQYSPRMIPIVAGNPSFDRVPSWEREASSSQVSGRTSTRGTMASFRSYMSSVRTSMSRSRYGNSVGDSAFAVMQSSSTMSPVRELQDWEV